MNALTKYITVFMMAPLAMACNQKEMDRLSSENQELDSANTQLNAELKEYMQTFNQIESNLAEIKKRENAINVKTSDNVEFKENDKREVVRDIEAINALMQDNRNKMNELQSKLDNTSSEFKTMVSRLNSRVSEKDNQIASMKEELTSLNMEKEELSKNVATLNEEVDTLKNKSEFQESVITAQNDKIENQYEALTTAYVVIGSYKDLEDKKVLDKDGGVLGLGRTEKLRSDFNQDAFTRINIEEESQIELRGKKAEVVTNHPKDSYKLELNDDEEIEKLVILNPNDFWKSSKYLVVMTN